MESTNDILFNKAMELLFQDKEDGCFESIIEEIKKYDIYDFINKLASLHLVPQNQNKANFIDVLISELLQQKEETFCSSQKISMGKFKKIIRKIEKSRLKYSLDLPENTFVQNVTFRGNNFMFNGMDMSPTYILQNMEKTIFEYRNDFPKSFIECANTLFSFFIHLIGDISKEKKYAENKYCPDCSGATVVPDAKMVDYNSSLIYLNGFNFDRYFREYDTTNFFSSFEMNPYHDINNLPIFTRPFIRDCNNNIIILDISLIPLFLITEVINIADTYGIKMELIKAFNSYTWYCCEEYLENLGHYKINTDKLNIETRHDEYYRERVVSVFENKLMLVLFCCDDGEQYNQQSARDNYPDDRHQRMIVERMEYYYKAIKNNNIREEDVFILFILNSYGRNLSVALKTLYFTNKPMGLSPFSLKCISINESEHKGFLPRYIKARNDIDIPAIGIIGELNAISIYTDNHYSFYCSDELDVKGMNLFIQPGESLEYIAKALSREKRQLFLSYEQGVYTEVIATKYENIFMEVNPDDNTISAAVKFKDKVFWLRGQRYNNFERLNIIMSVIDLLSYWLTELEEFIDKTNLSQKVITINIAINGTTEEYYLPKKEASAYSELIKIARSGNDVIIEIVPEVFYKLNSQDNSQEKELMAYICQTLDNQAFSNVEKASLFNEAFSNPLKKKFFAFDIQSNIYLQPIKQIDMATKVCEEEIEGLANEIGLELVNKYGYGDIPNDKRKDVANSIVESLYKKLLDEINEYNPKGLIEQIYIDLEITLHKLMIENERFIFDISCYPEAKERILESYNELNKKSLALKFLIEFVAACPPNGERHLGTEEYERFVTICSLILEWAYNSDFFKFNIIDTPLTMLKSNRVGMNRAELEKINLTGARFRENTLSYSSTVDLRKEYEIEGTDFSEDLDVAFFSERGYTYSDFIKVLFGLIVMCEERDRDVIVEERKKTIVSLIEYTQMDADVVDRVIQNVIIEKRENYLIPPKGFKKEDIYPWRYNRAYSFIRRPVIQRNEMLIWGKRQVFHAVNYLRHLIYNEKYKTKNKEMQSLVGKIAGERGNEYCLTISNMIVDMNRFTVHTKVKKINKKYIMSDEGEALGDIDILFIDERKRRIYVAEVKLFSFSRNPYEINNEYEKIFIANGKHRSLMEKHERRVRWVINNIDDVKRHFALDEKESWDVIDLFIVKDPIISNNIYNIKANILSEAELNLQNITKLKPSKLVDTLV